MKTLLTDGEPVTVPRFASCLRHGRHGEAHDALAGCPHCRRLSQSVTRYGISNALDAPLHQAAERQAWRVVAVAGIALVVLLSGFYLIVRQANVHLDASVARIERASR